MLSLYDNLILVIPALIMMPYGFGWYKSKTFGFGFKNYGFTISWVFWLSFLALGFMGQVQVKHTFLTYSLLIPSILMITMLYGKSALEALDRLDRN